MNSSFRLFKVFGIDVRVHSTFFLLPLFFLFIYSKDYGLDVGLRSVVLVLIVFACVLGHELSHSFVARLYKISVPMITLYPIGGVASMARIPHEAHKEFFISIVGPLFNFVLAALLFFPLYYTLGPDTLFSPSLDSWPGMIANAFWVNPILGLFNLIPAFPMDGGRILRSFLGFFISYKKATRISVYFGLFFAIIFFLLGVWRSHWMLALIGVYIYLSASEEKRELNRKS